MTTVDLQAAKDRAERMMALRRALEALRPEELRDATRVWNDVVADKRAEAVEEKGIRRGVRVRFFARKKTWTGTVISVGPKMVKVDATSEGHFGPARVTWRVSPAVLEVVPA